MDNQQQICDIYLHRQRQKKHRQIMNTITNYKRSPQQIKMLDKVRHATRMEIELRFKNCSQNQTYKFPFYENSFDEDLQEEQFPSKNYVLYDLHAQAEVVKKSMSTKTLSLDASRRVKSLQKQHTFDQQQIIIKHKKKIMNIGKVPVQNQLVHHKNSLRDRRPRVNSNFKLPQLKKLKSQKKIGIQQIIGKKIYTQVSASPQGKRLGKYLKIAQGTTKQTQAKKFFLQEV